MWRFVGVEKECVSLCAFIYCQELSENVCSHGCTSMWHKISGRAGPLFFKIDRTWDFCSCIEISFGSFHGEEVVTVVIVEDITPSITIVISRVLSII